MQEYKSQKKYNEKIKKLACNVFVDEAKQIEKHYQNKGFTSANSYLKYLIEKDLKKRTEDNSEFASNDEMKRLLMLIDRLDIRGVEKVIDYVQLLLK